MNEGFVRNKIESLPVSDGIALDIGANHGMYTSLLAQKFKKVYAFEPHPDNFKIIQERVTDKNVEFVNKAVGIIETLKNNKIEMILEVHQTVDCEKLWSFFNDLGYTSYAPTNKVTGAYINDEHYFITNK